jgi:perosamine synthetase
MLAIPRGRISHTLIEDLTSLLKASILPLQNKSKIKDYEEKFARYNNAKFCIAFPFARVAIFEILKSRNLPKGSKVLITPISIKGILDVIIALDLEPVFVDLDKKTGSINLESLRKVNLNEVHTAIVTYLFGLTPDVEPLMKIFQEKDIFVIEDFSQCLNGISRGTRIGNFGHAAVYSASSVKTLDTYGGGMLITNDSNLKDKMVMAQDRLSPPKRVELQKKIITDLLRNIATTSYIFPLVTFAILRIISRIGNEHYKHFVGARTLKPLEELPTSWFRKFTSVQASFGSIQIDKIQEKDDKRIRAWNKVHTKKPEFLMDGDEKSHSVYWQSIFAHRNSKKLMAYLIENKIDCATTSLVLLSKLPDYGIDINTPNADFIHANAIYLPCYHQLNSRQIEHINRSLEYYFSNLEE